MFVFFFFGFVIESRACLVPGVCLMKGRRCVCADGAQRMGKEVAVALVRCFVVKKRACCCSCSLRVCRFWEAYVQYGCAVSVGCVVYLVSKGPGAVP